MKWFLLLWAGPIAFLAAWYTLSYYDMSFGLFILSRQGHDLVFSIYGSVLGMPPEAIPPLVARALALDTLLVFALMALRKRKRILAWLQARRSRQAQPSSAPSADLAKSVSLSNAP